MLNLLGGADGKEVRSNPSRDIAHFWPQLVMTIKDGLFENVWEQWYGWFLKLAGVTQDHLLHTHACYFEFMRLSLIPEVRTPLLAMQESGFMACHPAAQLVVVAKLGQIATGAFWAGSREANVFKVIPPEIISIAEMAKMIKDSLGASWSQAYDLVKDEQNKQ